MSELRGFRFQTGEQKDILKSLLQKGSAEIDIDREWGLDDLMQDLTEKGLQRTGEMDEKAVDLVENPEFYGRIPVVYQDREGYLDFYLIEEEEKGYDEIFWG